MATAVEEYVEVKWTKKSPGLPKLAGRTIKLLSLKGFPAVPAEIAEARVADLTLSKCKVAALPAAMAEMKSLRRLSLIDCDLSALPAEAFAPPKLEELTVFFDRQTLMTEYPALELPDPLPARQSLTKLDIHGHVVPVVPESIAGYPDLEQLTVIPLVREVPSTLAGLRKLRELNLLHCDLDDPVGTLALIATLPLEKLTLSNIVADKTTEAAWRQLGKTVKTLLLRSFAIVAPGARPSKATTKQPPKVKPVIDHAVLESWMPKTKISR